MQPSSKQDLINQGYGGCTICQKQLIGRQEKTCSTQCQAKWLSLYNKQKKVVPPSRLGARVPTAKHRRINTGGYVELYEGDGKYATRQYEHRFVMEQYLGKQLKRSEHVHHLNGDKLDNRLENLIVIDIKEHGKLHSNRRSFRNAS